MNITGKQDIDTEDGEEMSIYVNVEEINNYDVCRGTEDTVTKTKPTSQHTGSGSVRSYRSVSVCLVLLCVLLLTAVIVLCVLINTNNQQFNIKTKNITEERDQLLLKYKNLTKENERLLTNNNNPNEQQNQLIQQIKAIMKTDGWKVYQSSLYFISSEYKNWTESRKYCRERGADLIIINNKEEQDFIQNNSGMQLHWVGLTYSSDEGRWKWVDGSTMNSR
nr:CD209 antigen-like protein C [Misgurnus anguillicaudatus]